jgi:hypothetical protein
LLLSAHLASHRLIVTLQSIAGAETACPFASMDLAPLHDRLARLFGRTARLTASSEPPRLTLNLPHLQEDRDDHRTNR